MYIAIFSALMSAVGFGLANVFIKKSMETTSVGQTLIFSNSVGFILLFIICIFNGLDFSLTSNQFLLLAAFGIFELILYLSLYKAFSVANVTVAAAILSTYPIFSGIFTIIFLKEESNLITFLIIFSIVIGAILTGINWNDSENGKPRNIFVKGLPWILLTLGLHAIYFPSLGKLTADGDWQISLMYIKLLGLPLYLYYFLKLKKTKIEFITNRVLLISFIGFLEIVGWVGISYASSITTGIIAIIVAIGSSAPIVTAIFARFIFKERIHIIQYIGIGLSFISTVLLVLNQ